MLNLDTANDTKRVFPALTGDGEVLVPLGPAPYAARFGMGADRFGTTWMVTGREPQQTS